MTPSAPNPKVTLICEGLVTTIGGAERVFCDLANHLADKGYDVDAVTHEKMRGQPWYPLSDKVRFVPLRPTPDSYCAVRRYLGEPLRDLARAVFHVLRLHRVPGVARLGRYLRQNRRDVAIAFMPRAIAALAFARVPYRLTRIASTHSTPQRNFVEVSDDPDNVAMPLVMRQALRRLDRITVLQPEFRAWYPPDLRPRTVVIANAIAIAPPADPRGREKLVLGVGRLIAVKGYDVLVDAWAQVAPRFADWHVEIWGQGPDKAALGAQIDAAGLSQSLRLMGSTKDIQSHYARAAILAHPAWHEGFGLVVAEAMAAGVPVLGFADCSGVNALIEDGENGLIVPGSSDRTVRVASFAQALGALIGDAERRAALGANGPASVARYAPETIMAQWQALIGDSWRAADHQPNSER